MKLTRRTVLAASMATLGSSLAAPAVKASPGWPTKQPIKLIATFPPGGTADTISRILAPKLSAAQETHLVGLYRAGQHTTAELAELFSVGRSTVYRAIQRAGEPRVARSRP